MEKAKSYIGRDKDNRLVFDATVQRTNKYPTRIVYDSKYGEREVSEWYGDKPARIVLITIITAAIGIIMLLAEGLFMRSEVTQLVPAENETGVISYMEGDFSYFEEKAATFQAEYGFPLNMSIDSAENWEAMGRMPASEIINAWIADAGTTEFLDAYVTMFLFYDVANPVNSELYVRVGDMLTPYITDSTRQEIHVIFDDLKKDAEDPSQLAGDFIAAMGEMIKQDEGKVKTIMLMTGLIITTTIAITWGALIIKRMTYKDKNPIITDDTGIKGLTEADWEAHKVKHRKKMKRLYNGGGIIGAIIAALILRLILFPEAWHAHGLTIAGPACLSWIINRIIFKGLYEKIHEKREKLKQFYKPVETDLRTDIKIISTIHSKSEVNREISD